ncbi:MAG: replicative DNA helicase [Chitinophagales bacterium]|jgi:replicative DNA helicase|nr:replicative DNA helicase [Chitinophagales bacterium]
METQLRKHTLSTPSIPFQDLGKLPPHNIEAERAILGAILIDANAMDLVIEILKKESFYHPPHQEIYEACIELANTVDIKAKTVQRIDYQTLSNQLERKGKLDAIGGISYLVQLTADIVSSANVEYYARIVAQKYLQRCLIDLGNKITNDAYNPTKDVFELLDETEHNLFQLSDNYTSSDPVLVSDALTETMEELQRKIAQFKEGGLVGVETGFKELNDITGGWQKSDLIIVAGRPGMGKTAITLAFARNAAVVGKKKVAFFSLEMSRNQVLNRLMSFEAEIDQEKIIKGNLNPDELSKITQSLNQISNASIFIDDTSGLSILDFRKKARKLKREHDIDLIMIDYLQIMTGKTSSEQKGGGFVREQEIAYISKSLKQVAKELQVPVIALAQVSRSVEKDNNSSFKKGKDEEPSYPAPKLSDLRESGAIEQDADLVLFINRKSYYTKDPNDNTGKLIVAKHRNGRLGDVNMRYKEKFTKFEDDSMPSTNFVQTEYQTFPSRINSETSTIDNSFLDQDDDFE